MPGVPKNQNANGRYGGKMGNSQASAMSPFYDQRDSQIQSQKSQISKSSVGNRASESQNSQGTMPKYVAVASSTKSNVYLKGDGEYIQDHNAAVFKKRFNHLMDGMKSRDHKKIMTQTREEI